MAFLHRRAACLLAALVLVAASAHICAAAGVLVKNELEQDIKAILCVDDQGKATQAVGALKAGASLSVPANKFPEFECNRLALNMADGGAWQFYQNPEPGGAGEIAFSPSKAHSNAAESYPSVLIDSAGDLDVTPAGVPLAFLVQAMEFGLDEARWRQMATPGMDALENPGAFAVAFADQSWSLAGDGLLFSEDLVPGMKLAELVNMVSEFSNPTIAAVFEGLQAMGATPLLADFGDAAAALDPKGLELNPDAKRMDNLDTDEQRWEALNELIQTAADKEGPVVIHFGSDAFTFALVLDLEDGAATLTITRRPEAAFG